MSLATGFTWKHMRVNGWRLRKKKAYTIPVFLYVVDAVSFLRYISVYVILDAQNSF
mgnify:FL=1